MLFRKAVLILVNLLLSAPGIYILTLPAPSKLTTFYIITICICFIATIFSKNAFLSAISFLWIIGATIYVSVNFGAIQILCMLAMFLVGMGLENAIHFLFLPTPSRSTQTTPKYGSLEVHALSVIKYKYNLFQKPVHISAIAEEFDEDPFLISNMCEFLEEQGEIKIERRDGQMFVLPNK